MTNIINRLKLPITAPSEMPKGFAALTYPIPLAQEEIIQSIWTSLRSTEALVTVAGDAVEFCGELSASLHRLTLTTAWSKQHGEKRANEFVRRPPESAPNRRIQRLRASPPQRVLTKSARKPPLRIACSEAENCAFAV